MGRPNKGGVGLIWREITVIRQTGVQYIAKAEGLSTALFDEMAIKQPLENSPVGGRVFRFITKKASIKEALSVF